MDTHHPLISVFRSMPTAALIVDADPPEFNVVDVNPAHLNLSGKSRETVVGRSVFDAFPVNPDDERSADKLYLTRSFEKVIETGEPDTMEEFRYDVEDADGIFEKRYWKSVNSPITDEDGSVTHVLQTVNEVTGKVKQEIRNREKLVRIGSLLKEAEKLANLGSWEYDLINQEMHWSARVYEMCGYRPEEYDLTLESAMAVIHPDDRESAKQEMQRAIEEKDGYRSQKRFITKQGDVRHILSKGRVVYDNEGVPQKIQGVFLDVTDVRDMEKQLNRSQQHFEAIIESIGGILWESRADTFDFLYVSPQTKQILGYAPEEWYQSGFWESKIHPDDREEAVDYCKKETTAGRDHTFEYRMYDADGNIVWLRDEVSVVKSEDGNKLLRGLMVDITAEKEQREKLQKNEARLKGIVDSPTNYLIRIDLEGRYTFCNRKYVEVFGWLHGGDDLLGVSYEGSVMPYHRDRLNKTGQKAVENPGAVFQVELDKPGPENSVKTTLWSINCITDSEGNPSEIQCIGIDITERKKVAKQLKLNEQRFKSLVQHGSDLIGICDEQGNYRYVSPTVKPILGYCPEELIGRNALEFIHEQDQQRFLEIIANLESTTRFKIDPYRFRAADGSWMWLETHVTNLLDDPAVMGVVANSRDITEQVEREEQIRSSLEEKKVLLAEIHHRVKNNLAVVSSMMQLQAYEEQEERVAGKLFDSMSRIKTMATIHELLYRSQSFSKLEFYDITEKLIESISSTYNTGKDIEISLDIDRVQLNINQAIPCALLINEVATNIYKHAFEGRYQGSVEIQIREHDSRIELQIEDNGIGLPDDFDMKTVSSLGVKLIDVLTQQIDGQCDFINTGSGTLFRLAFEKSELTGIDTTGLIG
jgi:PAS domain S-box-containing protein